MKKLTYRDGPTRDGAPTRVEYDMAEMSDLPVVPIEPWVNPDGSPADDTSGNIQYTSGNVGIGRTPNYGLHVDDALMYAKEFGASGGGETAYIQRSNDGVGNFHQYWNTEGSSSPVRLSTGYVANEEFTANSEWYQVRGADTDVTGSAISWTNVHYYSMKTGEHQFNQYGQGTFDSTAPARILGVDATGKVVEVDPDSLGGTDCPEPMTRAALMALKGSYTKDCHYVVTDYNRGNVGASTILLHAVDEDTLSQNVSVLTTHDTLAWDGVYDIDVNRMQSLHDNQTNRVKGQDAVDTFPWGVASVTQNTVENAIVNYTAGTMAINEINSSAVVTISGGTFSYNTVDTDANVTVSGGNAQRNTFQHQSNTTISAGDFRENTIKGDATVTSSTTGDVDNCEFGSISVIRISGTANVDTVDVYANSNLTMSGGALADSTIEQDSQVVLYGGTHYENLWGTSVVFNQVSGTTAYVRYSEFKGTTTWTHGGVNLSNVNSYGSTVNTTGSAGTISQSTFNRAYLINVRGIPSLTITDSTLSGYAQISANDATRVYVYRCNMDSAGRILCSAGTTFNASYSSASDYSYFQVMKGVLTANYSNLSSRSYIQNNTDGTNYASYDSVTGNSNIRFLGTSNNCRVYYSTLGGNSTIYHNGSSSGAYMYYCSAMGGSSIYTNNTINARIYYTTASGRGRVYSNGNTSTHYIYYCTSNSGAMLEMRTCTGSRIYGVDTSGLAIARLQNSTAAGRFYYSNIAAYYYLYITLTATRSALMASGRRTNTVTNPGNGTPQENF